MKKNILYIILIITTISLLFGCEIQTAGQATQEPDQTVTLEAGEKFAVFRTIGTDEVQLDMNFANLQSQEIVIVADRVPDGVSIDYTQTITPTPSAFSDASLIVWMFTDNPDAGNPVTIGGITVDQDIPSRIIYKTTGSIVDPCAPATQNCVYRGKWGLETEGIDALFEGDTERGTGGSANSNYDFEDDGDIDMIDVFKAFRKLTQSVTLNDQSTKVIDMLFVYKIFKRI
jgi:hypothetical protein